MNALKTTFLLTLLTVLLILAGEYFGGGTGAWVAFIIAAAMTFVDYGAHDLERIYAERRAEARREAAGAGGVPR